MNVSTQERRDRAWVEVNLANLIANARTVQQAAAGAALLPMVKADSYGLGAVRVAQELEVLSPWGFGVATVAEGRQLRAAGITRPIVVFTPTTIAAQAEYQALGLRAVLDDPAVVQQWRQPFHLEIDSGMGRCGLRFDDERLATITSPHLEGVFTHFFAADDRPESVAEQWARFEAALRRIPRSGFMVHAANSAGAWRLDRCLDLIRPGIFLYGGRCGADLPAPKPVAAVRARVASLRRLPRGATVSYGGEWAAPFDTTVATLSIGYADGVKWTAKGRAAVLLHGSRYPVVGRITMDFVMVNLEPGAASAAVGDVATLIGRDGSAEITVDEFASWAGTISYEVLTGLGSRLPREYVSSLPSEDRVA